MQFNKIKVKFLHDYVYPIKAHWVTCFQNISIILLPHFPIFWPCYKECMSNTLSIGLRTVSTSI